MDTDKSHAITSSQYSSYSYIYAVVSKNTPSGGFYVKARDTAGNALSFDCS